ncbi:hypothetical protein RUND412_001463 [Rhizina undulata]
MPADRSNTARRRSVANARRGHHNDRYDFTVPHRPVNTTGRPPRPVSSPPSTSARKHTSRLLEGFPDIPRPRQTRETKASNSRVSTTPVIEDQPATSAPEGLGLAKFRLYEPSNPYFDTNQLPARLDTPPKQPKTPVKPRKICAVGPFEFAPNGGHTPQGKDTFERKIRKRRKKSIVVALPGYPDGYEPTGTTPIIAPIAFRFSPIFKWNIAPEKSYDPWFQDEDETPVSAAESTESPKVFNSPSDFPKPEEIATPEDLLASYKKLLEFANGLVSRVEHLEEKIAYIKTDWDTEREIEDKENNPKSVDVADEKGISNWTPPEAVKNPSLKGKEKEVTTAVSPEKEIVANTRTNTRRRINFMAHAGPSGHNQRIPRSTLCRATRVSGNKEELSNTKINSGAGLNNARGSAEEDGGLEPTESKSDATGWSEKADPINSRKKESPKAPGILSTTGAGVKKSKANQQRRR